MVIERSWQGSHIESQACRALRSRSIATKIVGQLEIGYPRRFRCSTASSRPIFRPKSTSAQVGQGSKTPDQNCLIQSMPRQPERYWAPQDQNPCPDSVSFAVSNPTVMTNGRLNQFLSRTAFCSDLFSHDSRLELDVSKIEILKFLEKRFLGIWITKTCNKRLEN